MIPFHIKIDWVDFNPTIESDIYSISLVDKDGNIYQQRETVKCKVPLEIAKLLRVCTTETYS